MEGTQRILRGVLIFRQVWGLTFSNFVSFFFWFYKPVLAGKRTKREGVGRNWDVLHVMKQSHNRLCQFRYGCARPFCMCADCSDVPN